MAVCVVTSCLQIVKPHCGVWDKSMPSRWLATRTRDGLKGCWSLRTTLATGLSSIILDPLPDSPLNRDGWHHSGFIYPAMAVIPSSPDYCHELHVKHLTDQFRRVGTLASSSCVHHLQLLYHFILRNVSFLHPHNFWPCGWSILKSDALQNLNMKHLPNSVLTSLPFLWIWLTNMWKNEPNVHCGA